MVRKFAAALVALAIAVGSVFAEEIRGTFVKFAEKIRPESIAACGDPPKATPAAHKSGTREMV